MGPIGGTGGRRSRGLAPTSLAVLGLLAGLLGSGAAGAAAAQEPEPEQDERQEQPELATDRPDFTESAVVVPPGSVQLEMGLTWERRRASRAFNAPELLVRWGVGRRTELRFGAPDYNRTRAVPTGRHFDGFGDTSLGFKQQFGPLPAGFDLALIGGISVPTGDDRFSSGAVDPEAVLAWARDLTERASLSGGFGIFLPTEDPELGRNETGFVTFTLGYALGERWNTFLEYAGELPEQGGNAHLAHHGYSYGITPTSQADVHFGVGLSPAAPDFFIGAGYVVRYGK
jgi:hypothetical protein